MTRNKNDIIDVLKANMGESMRVDATKQVNVTVRGEPRKKAAIEILERGGYEIVHKREIAHRGEYVIMGVKNE